MNNAKKLKFAIVFAFAGIGCGTEVDAPFNGDEPLASQAHALTGASQFGCAGSRIALRASTGHYLVAESGGGREVRADRARIGPWETFTVYDAGAGRVAFQVANGDFFCAEHGGGGPLLADRPWVGPWESFSVERHWDGVSFALRSIHGAYVVAEGGGGREVNADRGWVGPWEAFQVVCLY